MSEAANPFTRQDFKGEVVEEYSGLTAEEVDRLTLDHLRARGSDLTLPRHIIHHLYFDSSTERDQAATAVRDRGYKANLPDPEKQEVAYLLRAERIGIADEENIGKDRIVLSEIANQHDGYYDGWAAAEDN